MENLIELMERQEATVGRFETTVAKHRDKRIKRLYKFNEKTLAIIEVLKTWNIPFTLCEVLYTPNQSQRVTTDIFIPEANIVIRQMDAEDENEVSKMSAYYNAMKSNYYPFFVRPSETQEFIMEKLNNVIKQANDVHKIGFKSVKFLKVKKPKRQRIKAVKVEPRKKQNSVY